MKRIYPSQYLSTLLASVDTNQLTTYNKALTRQRPEDVSWDVIERSSLRQIETLCRRVMSENVESSTVSPDRSSLNPWHSQQSSHSTHYRSCLLS